jgi:putative acyl-CoA dehydrogenase
MDTLSLQDALNTHEVFNQVPPLVNYNAFETDAALREGVAREGAGWALEELRAFGAVTGREDVIALGFAANKFTPEFKSHDNYGHRIDLAEFHPSYHELMRLSMEAEIHALPWNRPQAGAHVARVAKHYLMTQVEAGHLCPITMTFAAMPALRMQPEIAAEWGPRIASRHYDPSFRPAPDKAGCTMGMAMTEKQGGSDVRANTTRAEAIGAEGQGQEYLLTGHKWFCSAPMCDAFLTLAQTTRGLSCFLVPRWLPDGAKNRFFVQRLKNKLGNKSNASSEIEYQDTWARMVGEEGRGVPTIIEMVNHTRLDCFVGTSALMRQALAQAIHHCTHRSAFGKRLIEQALMKNVLADLALESIAATTLMLRLARGYDDAVNDPNVRAFVRIATAITKYYICKRGPAMGYEALECHGGNGYVEDAIMARIYREMPLASIWEGSGNVMCLDVLRAMAREPETIPAIHAELASMQGRNTHYDRHIASLAAELGDTTTLELRARRVVERLAVALEACALLRGAPDYIAEAFCRARLTREAGDEYGTLPTDLPFDRIIAYAAAAG